MNRIPNIHPGEILSEEPSSRWASRLTGFRRGRTSTRRGRARSSEASAALRRTPRFAWRVSSATRRCRLNLQAHYDLEHKKREMEKDLKKIRPYVPQSAQV